MNALTRVWRAPRLILLLIVVQLATAVWLSAAVRDAIGRALEPYSILMDGRFLGLAIALLRDHPELAAGYLQALTGSLVISLVIWILISPTVITRLATAGQAPATLPSAGRHLPAVLAVTLWHLVPRAILLAIVGAATKTLMPHGNWGLAGLALTAVTLAFCTCALDLARCHVVLHGARRWHYSTALRAFGEASRRPRVLLPSMVWSFAQWGCTIAMLVIAINAAGAGSTIWVVRALAVLGILFGLTRIAVAVEAGPDPGRT